MSILAARMRNIRPSETKAMTAKAGELRERGRSVITLSQGEPDFDTPANVRAAAITAIDEGHTRYTAVAGITPLREAIRQKFLRDNDLSYSIDQITVGTGAKQVVFNALFATLDPGDEVIVPTPCWVSYPDMVRLAGGTPVPVACRAEDGFKLTPDELERAITPRTKWLMLNSPGNPTGAVYRDVELAALGSVLARHPHVWVLTDDIYEKLVYGDARFATMARAAPDLFHRTLTVNGVSKTNAMTGWRIGYGAGPLDLIKAMNVIQGQTTSHATSIAQHAAIEALTGDQSYITDFVDAFEQRRNLMVRRLNAIPGLQCLMPDGAFYVFVSCAALIGTTVAGGRRLASDTDVAMHLLESAGVAVVPGASFLASPYIRISFAAGLNELTEACDRIEQACIALVQGDAA